jgi:hypothetical protein
MSASHRWKLLAGLVLIVVAVAGVVSYFISNRATEPFTVTPTSTVTPGPYPVTLTPALSTVSEVQTPVDTSWRPTEWITIGPVKSINHYLSLLESNHTEPYVQLARELRKLPGLTNATAVAKITFLALNSTNPEVKEALELVMKGGTPDPRDFGYSVPRYNTEFQVLYWLACQNEFKRDDTLALAIAMDNGLWVTMGDEQVRERVKKDPNEMLNFFRETNEIQKARGYPQLEYYPLEAKLSLAWSGGNSPKWGKPRPLMEYVDSKLSLDAYQRMTFDPSNLSMAREFAVRNHLWIGDIPSTIDEITRFAYDKEDFDPYPYNRTRDEQGIVTNDDYDWLFARLLTTGRFTGDCGATRAVSEYLSKSLGIASLPWWVYFPATEHAVYRGWASHGENLYYIPERGLFLGSQYRARAFTWPDMKEEDQGGLILFIPPVIQHGYLREVVVGKYEGPDGVTQHIGSEYAPNHLGSFGEIRRLIYEDGISVAVLRQIMGTSNIVF